MIRPEIYAFYRWMTLCAFVAVVSLWVAFITGCSHFLPAYKPAAALVSLPSGATLQQSGPAQVPAKVTTTTETKTLPLPSGSDMVFNEKLGTFTLHFAAPSTLQTETKTEHAEAPQSFAPPAPPTPAQEADAKARFYYYLGLVVGVAAAAFGLVRGWDFVMVGGAVVAGACAFALFVQSHPVIFVLIGIGCALKFAGPYFYHTYIKPNTAPTK